jgi:hypothetical protein
MKINVCASLILIQSKKNYLTKTNNFKLLVGYLYILTLINYIIAYRWVGGRSLSIVLTNTHTCYFQTNAQTYIFELDDNDECEFTLGNSQSENIGLHAHGTYIF